MWRAYREMNKAGVEELKLKNAEETPTESESLGPHCRNIRYVFVQAALVFTAKIINARSLRVESSKFSRCRYLQIANAPVLLSGTIYHCSIEFL